jgi:hypothetical protein
MHQFMDNANRRWEINVNVAAVKRVRSLLKVDLPGLFDGKMKPLVELFADPCQFVDVLWVLIEKQAQALSVSDVSFGEAMGGDVLLTAADAFVEEIADFFPGAKADSLRKILSESRKAAKKVENAAQEILATLDGEEEAALWLKKQTSSCGDVPASAA